MINRSTGQAITLEEHITQSIIDIITTRIGTRVMRRDYGSLLPDLIDRPSNDETIMQLMSATVIAITQWEPRITATFVNFEPTDIKGKLEIEIMATIKENNQQFYMNQLLFMDVDAMNDLIKGDIND